MASRESIRLPELPVFKKYSLALRQEFAEAKEIIGLLERTLDRVASIVEAAEADEEREEGEWPAAEPEEDAYLIANRPQERTQETAPPGKRPKRKPKRPAVVAVSRHGRPLASSAAGGRKPASKKSSAKSSAGKKAITKKTPKKAGPRRGTAKARR